MAQTIENHYLPRQFSSLKIPSIWNLRLRLLGFTLLSLRTLKIALMCSIILYVLDFKAASKSKCIISYPAVDSTQFFAIIFFSKKIPSITFQGKKSERSAWNLMLENMRFFYCSEYWLMICS